MFSIKTKSPNNPSLLEIEQNLKQMGRQQLQNKQIFHGSAELQISSALKA